MELLVKKGKLAAVQNRFVRYRIGCVALLVLLMLNCAVAVYAEDREGESGWKVEFTGNTMTSNFNAQQIADAVYEMQPGDSVVFHVSVQNSSDIYTDWYMTNEVLQSLEDTQAVAENGGYTYILTYTNVSGEETTLYSSDSIGGEKETAAGAGLNEATDSLDEYFFLDRLAPEDKGEIYLYVSLDGESQGNIYQDTLADLQMNFAVEKVSDITIVPESKRAADYKFLKKYITKTSTVYTSPWATALSAVKTGDVQLGGSVVALIGGIVLLVLVFIRTRRREERI